ncbi:MULTISPECIES: ferredoxin [unclassified Mycobacterium]|uniref:ferredoxin n=1 Tax=unclassified Mycobacterium TaxID=2642494 RepID=UPI000A512037|nr:MULTISPECIES: ferredoxin [unclassified Mycobacterium]
MTIRIEFDAAHCVGHALCAAAGPDVYHLDDTGYCIPPEGEVAAAFIDQAHRGADACPERAITVIERSTPD